MQSSSDPEKVVEKKKVEKELNAVKVQLISDLCDIAIPSSALGWVDLDDGIVGLAGTTSSLLGVAEMPVRPLDDESMRVFLKLFRRVKVLIIPLFLVWTA